jgi:hypothetical protein
MWLINLIKKIELQSVLVLFITLFFGYKLLGYDNSLKSPAGILGSLSIGIGILYTLFSFFSNQIKESYKDVINEYKTTLSTTRTSHKAIEETLIKSMKSKDETKKISDNYQTEGVDLTPNN